MTHRLLLRALFAFPLVAAAALAVAPVAASPIALSERRSTKVLAERNAEGFELGTEALTVAPPTAGELAAFFAVENVGVPYRWGGESPDSGFDCSGLVRWSYGRVGVDVPHNSHALFGVGRRVPRAAMEPGDVLFFRGLGHVGLYIGSGQMVHAPYSGKSVEIVRLSATNYGRRLIGARRLSASVSLLVAEERSLATRRLEQAPAPAGLAAAVPEPSEEGEDDEHDDENQKPCRHVVSPPGVGVPEPPAAETVNGGINHLACCREETPRRRCSSSWASPRAAARRRRSSSRGSFPATTSRASRSRRRPSSRSTHRRRSSRAAGRSSGTRSMRSGSTSPAATAWTSARPPAASRMRSCRRERRA